MFKLFGIQVRLDYSWFLSFLLLLWSLSAGYLPAVHPGGSTGFYWLIGFVAVVLFFTSLLLHELAHALVAKSHGMKTPTITLFLFGGVSELREEPEKPGWEFRIAIVAVASRRVISETRPIGRGGSGRRPGELRCSPRATS